MQSLNEGDDQESKTMKWTKYSDDQWATASGPFDIDVLAPSAQRHSLAYKWILTCGLEGTQKQVELREGFADSKVKAMRDAELALAKICEDALAACRRSSRSR